MHFTCNIRLDITFEIGQLSKYNANLRKSYMPSSKKSGLIFEENNTARLNIY